MSGRKDFQKLTGKNLAYVEEHQWPPVSYLKELAAYKKATGTEDEGGKKEENCCVQ